MSTLVCTISPLIIIFFFPSGFRFKSTHKFKKSMKTPMLGQTDIKVSYIPYKLYNKN